MAREMAVVGVSPGGFGGAGAEAARPSTAPAGLSGGGLSFQSPQKIKLPGGMAGVFQLYSAIRHHRKLHGKEMCDMQSAFGAFDLNGDGVVSRSEFQKCCHDLDLGLTKQQVRRAVALSGVRVCVCVCVCVCGVT